MNGKAYQKSNLQLTRCAEVNPVSLETISDGVDRGLAERNFLLGGLMKSSPSDAR